MTQQMRFKDAGAVRALLDGEKRRLEVLAIPYGSPARRDRLGQWFSARTDLMIQLGDRRPTLYMHGFSPQKRMMAHPPVLGVAEVSRIDQDGVWMTTELDDSELSTRSWEAAKAGKARASTGSVNYLERHSVITGEVELWPIAELSVFDSGPNRVPVSDDAVVLPLRMLYNDLEIDFPEAFEAGEAKGGGGELQEQPIRSAFAQQGVAEMTTEIDQAVAAALAKRDADAAAQAAHDKEVVEAYKKENPPEQARRAVFNVPKVTAGAGRLDQKDKEKGFTVEDAKEMHEQVYALRMAGLSKNPGAFRVLEESEAAEGGPMIAAMLLDRIWAKRGVYSIVRKSGMPILTSDTLTFNIPTETTAMAIAPTIAEEGAYVANEPAFTTTAVTLLKKGSMVTVTEELLEDQSLFQSYFANAAGRALGLAENIVLFDAINTIDGVEIGVAGAPTVAEFDAKYFSLAQQYRDGAVWITNDVTIGYIRGLLVATPRAYGSYPDLVPGELETFQGKPIYANSNWPTLAAAGDDALFMSFINLGEAIAWVDHSSGLKIFVDPYGDSANGRVRYFPRARFAAAVVNSDAMVGMDDTA